MKANWNLKGKSCEVGGCFNPSFARGRCRYHYRPQNPPKPNRKAVVKRSPHRRGSAPKRRKPTGEALLFKIIWTERPHYCVWCGEWLGNEACTFHFSHIIPKGRWPDLRLDPTNIRLLCFECHQAYDQGTKKQYEARRNIHKAT